MTIELKNLDLVGTGDIARRCGVSRSAPAQWAVRGASGEGQPFPEPLAMLNGDKVGVWNWPDVEAWLRLTGRQPLEAGRLYNGRGVDITDAKLAEIAAREAAMKETRVAS